MAMELNRVSVSEAQSILQAVIGNAFEQGVVPPNVMLHGTYGVGKSAIIAQMADTLAEESGKPCQVIDIRLGCYEASEVQGVPYNGDDYDQPIVRGESVVAFQKTMKHSTPEWFPTDPEINYILFLDEFSNAPIDVQQAAYRLLLDRSIQNGRRLPDSVAIVLAGNLKEDKTGVKPLLPAAANRIHTHLIIDTDRIAIDFVDYMFEQGWHRSLLGYLSWRKQSVVDTSEANEVAIARPRTWEAVNKHLNNPRLQKDEHLMEMCIAGAVGSAMAMDFAGYRQYENELPDFAKIRSGKAKFNPPKNAEDPFLFALALSLSYEMRDCLSKVTDGNKKKMESEVTNLAALLDHISREMKTVFFKSLAGGDRSVMRNVFSFPALRSHFQEVGSALKRFGEMS